MSDGLLPELPTIDLGEVAEDLLSEGHDAAQTAMMAEAVILVTPEDVAIGPISKFDAHRNEGALHRAFSVLLFDGEGRMLLQRRALDKITFPGIWANSCCSHPLHTPAELIEVDDEGVKHAAIRKLEQELGIPAEEIPIEKFTQVGRFLYKARMNADWVEHELDHVVMIQADVTLQPNPNEIHETAWVGEDEFEKWCEETRARGEEIAPWFESICQLYLTRCWPQSQTEELYDPSIHPVGDVSHMLKAHEGSSASLLAAVTRHKPEVENRIVEALSRSGQPRLRKAMLHLIEGGGKRMRATLPMIVAEAVGEGNPGLYDVGAAIEIIHNFTLVHDDIMDADEVRRGRPAVHVEFDFPTAINAGDAMLAVGFEVLANSVDIKGIHLQELVLTIGEMVRRVAEGQQLDIGFESEDDVSENEYLEMIEGKTAVMFRTCGRIGALLSGASAEIVEAMTEWGLSVGMCFQLMDDLIDVLSDSDTLGKPAGSDLARGKRTLMVIHALKQPNCDAKSAVLAVLGGGENVSEEALKAGIEALHQLGSVAHARNMAESFHSKAHECLNSLTETPGINALRELTDFQLKRLA